MYVLERSVLDLIPAGENVSIERDVFPRLVGEGLHGLLLDGYWMDIGTPERYLQASWDILEGRVATRVEPTAPGVLIDSRRRGGAGRRDRPARRRRAGLPGRGWGGDSRLGAARRLRGRRGRPRRRLDPLAPGAEVGPGGCLKVPWSAEGERGSAHEPCSTTILAIPDHLRDALWRVESARLQRGESAGLIVCGMGGSAIGGDLAAAALATV